jgi:hypothetical protein
MAEDGRRVVALPSGRQADIRKGKGRDLMRAHRAVAGNPEPMSVSFALIAEVARIEGKPLVYEDLLDMDLDDVLTLEAEVMGGGDDRPNFQAPAARSEDKDAEDPSQPRSSPDLSLSASPSQN